MTLILAQTDQVEQIDWNALLLSLAVLAGVVIVALLAHALIWGILARVFRAERSPFVSLLVKHTKAPARLALPLLAVQGALPAVDLAGADGPVRHGVSIALIAAAAWLLTRVALAGEEAIVARHRTDVPDNIDARRVRTQVKIARRVLAVIIWIIAGASAIMTFPGAGQLGASLLASAGIVGIVVGMAARPILSNVLAGMQLAATQPIRLDDVVIVHGEWGRIEEITTTYVVVRIWDERRLIVPLNDFIEKPFQNWTRQSAEILGTAFIFTDFTVPVEAVRTELRRICENDPRWNKKVCVLQVTDTKPEGVELRALVSADDAGRCFDLRCAVREALVAYLQQNHPGALVKRRVDLAPNNGALRELAGAS